MLSPSVYRVARCACLLSSLSCVGGSCIARVFCDFFAVILSVQSCVRPVCVAILQPLALMNSASEVPIGLSTLEEGR